MFASAFKSFTSNIGVNYEIGKQPTAVAGVWTIFEAKKKSTGAAASVFVFDRKSLDVPAGFGARASATSVKKAQDEVVERLKKEASLLARLRHPSILQLVEPVEDARNGGLMFATEPVTASLSNALRRKDEKRSSRRRPGESQPTQDGELDDLEIQKGLLQVAKGLEFLHDSAKLVHGNLTPEAIFINAKSDWKISGLGFTGPADRAEGHQSIPQISLSELLHLDARIPQDVQMNLDYSSPDFILDSNINFSADMFSLGLVLLACYRSPHVSPVETHGSLSTYKKVFSSSSTAPSAGNNYLCSNKLPQEVQQVLPRLLTRRPATRMNAVEFQQSEYFDNILVNTMRFFDALPAKTPAEKSQFMRGLGRVMPQFPVSVLSKKVMSALLDEMKDRDLLGVILQNIFQILKMIPNREEVLSAKVLPKLTETFLGKTKSDERDTTKEAGLVVFLDNVQLISENCTAKQFKDDALPIIHVAMESSTHSLVDAALSTLSIILPVLDFSTVKHDLFPVIANVFSKTSSLGIKVRGLDALGVLCGATGSSGEGANDDLAGLAPAEKPTKSLSSLDKFTMQEKVIPLVRAIKTKEPAVMMAALKVLKQIALVADADFLATDVIPILWNFALGPLLNLNQFKAFMSIVRSITDRIEREQIRKLQDFSSSDAPTDSKTRNTNSHINGSRANGGTNPEDDFAKLVLGGRAGGPKDVFDGVLTDGQKLSQNAPTFSWSSTTAQPQSNISTIQGLSLSSRSITPDIKIASFPSLQPNTASSTSAWSSPPAASANQQQKLQATNFLSSAPAPMLPPPTNNIWQTAAAAPNIAPTTRLMPSPPQGQIQGFQPQSLGQRPNYNVGSTQSSQPMSAMGVLQPRPSPTPAMQQSTTRPQVQQQKSGLDRYESLL